MDINVKEQFEEDTKDHTIEILLNEGVYRHLKCSNNGSQVYRFDITTWPGHLCVSGDMGTYVFSRLYDMLEFFGEDKINPGYWGEKLQAQSCNGTTANSVKEFSEELFRENVKNEYDMFKESYEGDENAVGPLKELWQAIEDNVFAYMYDGEIRAYDAAMDFTWESDDGTMKFNMQYFWDYNCREYTYHYIWILHAITWAIRALPEGFKTSDTELEKT